MVIDKWLYWLGNDESLISSKKIEYRKTYHLNPNQSDIKLKSVLNFRDIGGVASGDVTAIRNGIVFRSANIDRISRSDIRKLHKLGIKTIIDLRAPSERRKHFTTIGNIDKIFLTLDFEKKTREKLRPYFFKKNSENIISDISNSLNLEILDACQPVIKQIFDILLSASRCPILIHCQAGKDRTGIICALLQLALKADKASIIDDYLKSNEALIPYFRRMLMIRRILSFGFFPSDTVLFAITLRQRNIDSVLDRINNHYGGIEGYLNSSGVSDAQLSILRERLTRN